MSIDICECGTVVDTDADPDFYVDEWFYNAGKEKACESCRDEFGMVYAEDEQDDWPKGENLAAIRGAL